MGDEQDQPPNRPPRPAMDLVGQANHDAIVPDRSDDLPTSETDTAAQAAAGEGVGVGLAQRLSEEEAAREAAPSTTAAQARAAVARQARDTQAAGAPATAVKRPAKWPPIVAAGLVVLLGAWFASKITSTDQGAATDAPAESASSPAALAEPSSAPSAQFARPEPGTVYVVQPGDTLNTIAEKAGRSPQQISQANGSSGQLIYVRAGQRINIPK